MTGRGPSRRRSARIETSQEMVGRPNDGAGRCRDLSGENSPWPDNRCGRNQAVDAERKAEGAEAVMVHDGVARTIIGPTIMLSACLRIGWSGAAMVGLRRGGQEPSRQPGPCPCRHGQIGNRHLDQQSQDGKPAYQHTAASDRAGGNADPGDDTGPRDCPATSHAGEPPVAEGRSHRSRAALSGQVLPWWRDDLPTPFNATINGGSGAGSCGSARDAVHRRTHRAWRIRQSGRRP